MENPELANTIRWLGFWETVSTIAFFGVILTLAIEFAADRFAKPLREQIDSAREMQIASLRDRAAKSELDLAKLRAPRKFSDEGIAKLVEALKPFAGQEFTVTTYWDAKEPSAFTRELVAVLTMAGWTFIPHERWHGLMGGIEGVIVHAHPDAIPKTKGAREALVNALRGVGISADPKEEVAANNPAHNKINLNIGQKPQ